LHDTPSGSFFQAVQGDFMPDKVTCDGCGFLAVRHYSERHLSETEGDIRKYGKFPGDPKNPDAVYIPMALCFVLAYDLPEEIVPTEESDQIAFLRIIRKQRTCGEFTKWRQGFSPKEHREMIDRQWEQERQERRDESTKKFQERLIRRHHYQTIGMSLLAAIIGVVGTIIAAKLVAP
jgi:hypothetical protein